MDFLYEVRGYDSIQNPQRVLHTRMEQEEAVKWWGWLIVVAISIGIGNELRNIALMLRGIAKAMIESNRRKP